MCVCAGCVCVCEHNYKIRLRRKKKSSVAKAHKNTKTIKKRKQYSCRQSIFSFLIIEKMQANVTDVPKKKREARHVFTRAKIGKWAKLAATEW